MTIYSSNFLMLVVIKASAAVHSLELRHRLSEFHEHMTVLP